MPSRDVFVQEVEKLLSVQKTLAGVHGANWQPGRNSDESAIKVSLEIGGEILGPELHVVAWPAESGKFSVLLVHFVAVCRLDVAPMTERHDNPFPMRGESHEGGPIWGPHIHRWELNRKRIESPVTKMQKIRVAEPYTGSTKLMAAVRWFCGETNIVMPHGVIWELPKKDQLF